MKKTGVRNDRGAGDPGRRQHPVGPAERRYEAVKGDRLPIHRYEADLNEKTEADDQDEGTDECFDGTKALLIMCQNDPAERARDQGAGQQRSPEQQGATDAGAEQLGEIGGYHANLADYPKGAGQWWG